jgi:hypothetical protein
MADFSARHSTGQLGWHIASEHCPSALSQESDAHSDDVAHGAPAERNDSQTPSLEQKPSRHWPLMRTLMTGAFGSHAAPGGSCGRQTQELGGVTVSPFVSGYVPRGQ